MATRTSKRIRSVPINEVTASSKQTSEDISLPMVPSGYDPVTLNHFLWWKYRCSEASGEQFQKLFEEVIKRAKPKFMQIRPYGNIGDRKCDGLYFHEGVVFQVYSPDELKQAEVQSKIEEDLAGAVEHWKEELRKWVFVYNVRRGLPPDIPSTLYEQKKKYPKIELDHMSSDYLWELVRVLNLQQRCEILGAPAGYDHFFLMPASVSEETTSQLRRGIFAIIQDVMSPVNIQAIVDALHPDKLFGPPALLRPPNDENFWELAAEYQKHAVNDTLVKSLHLLPRFAVFSLSPIPLAIHLGFLLTDRLEVKLFQFDRDRNSWIWDDTLAANADTNIKVSELPDVIVKGPAEVIVRFSLSAVISRQETTTVAGDSSVQIDITVDEPDVMWLRSPKQLVRLGEVFRKVLNYIDQKIPECPLIHLFYAGPTGGAVKIGQAINPRMHPPVALYEYSRQQIPRYQRVMTLTDTKNDIL